jgi:hypothetical protein
MGISKTIGRVIPYGFHRVLAQECRWTVFNGAESKHLALFVLGREPAQGAGDTAIPSTISHEYRFMFLDGEPLTWSVREPPSVGYLRVPVSAKL